MTKQWWIRCLAVLVAGVACSALVPPAQTGSRPDPQPALQLAEAEPARVSQPAALPDAPQPIELDTARVDGQPEAEPGPRSPRFPTEFQVTAMRGVPINHFVRGNTIESFRAAYAQGVRYVEADLFTTADGVLVSAHEAHVSGCGNVQAMNAAAVLRCRLQHGRRVASLPQLLQLPFVGIYLDLKETKKLKTAERAVRAAAEAVTQAGRQDDVVLMVYQAPENIVRIIREHGLRAGMKGYPQNPEDTEKLVRSAAEVGFEMLCVKAKYVTPELVKLSAELGVWHLPWSINAGDVAHWRALAEAGAGGMIVLHHKTARDRVAPHWVDVTAYRTPEPPAEGK